MRMITRRIRMIKRKISIFQLNIISLIFDFFLQWAAISKLLPFPIYFINHGIHHHEIFMRLLLRYKRIPFYFMQWKISSLGKSSQSNFQISFNKCSFTLLEFTIGYHAHSKTTMKLSPIPPNLNLSRILKNYLACKNVQKWMIKLKSTINLNQATKYFKWSCNLK